MQGERIREIRKVLNLTMEKFGNRLGVTKTAISKIERGERGLTDQMALAICREFNVSFDWLVDGAGEMFDALPETILDEICLQYDLDSIDRALIEEYLKLTESERKTIKKYINNVFLKK